MQCSFNTQKQALVLDSELIMIKSDLVDSICEIAENKHLLQAGVDLLVISDSKVISKVKVEGGYNLERSLLLPDFDIDHFPFLVDYGSTENDGHTVMKSHAFKLVNLSTGRVNILIASSAQNIMPQQAAFFTKTGEGRFTLDFCTVQQSSSESTYEQSWHQMSFNSDFTAMLKEYGRIPKLNTMTECVEMECRNDELKRENK